LPEPDSPTKPTTSEALIVRSTCSTARNAGVLPRRGYSMATPRRSTTARAASDCSSNEETGGLLRTTAAEVSGAVPDDEIDPRCGTAASNCWVYWCCGW